MHYAVPLPLAGGARGGQCSNMPIWKPRDTKRARELRNAATPAERRLWSYLNKSQIGAKFSRQMQVGYYFPDFLCRRLKLIIELDGFSHDVEPERDLKRDAYLDAEGYLVLHFANRDVFANVEGVIEVVRIAVADRPTPNPSRKREGE